MLRTRVLVVCLLSSLFLLSAVPSASALSSRDARASRAMIIELNKVRAAYGLPRLRSSRKLRRGAFRHAGRMMGQDVFAHATLHRTPPFRRLSEVIALRRGWGDPARRTVLRWLASPPHRVILLSPGYRYAGGGLARGRFRGRRSTSWVVRFGKR